MSTPLTQDEIKTIKKQMHDGLFGKKSPEEIEEKLINDVVKDVFAIDIDQFAKDSSDAIDRIIDETIQESKETEKTIGDN